MFRTVTLGELTKKQAGKTVTLAGWVHSRRDHGGIIFLDLRDRYGLTQVAVHPEAKEAFEAADKVRSEFVVQVEGEVVARPENMVNKKLTTGEIEVIAKSFKVLSASKTPPFEISEFNDKVGEDVRLEHRYLDLRREKMKRNMELRSAMIQHIREYMTKQNFLEIETPILAKGTPEGAREFLVPSRLHAGEFYVLPQSPQQFKQLLMVSGLDRYFQIARCFRDEDQRGDRQPEFTQLDVEMSFVEQEDVMALTEALMIDLAEKFAGERELLKKPFPRLTYREAMDKYGVDKPDLRYDLPIVDVTENFANTQFKVFQKVVGDGGVVKALLVPHGLELSRKEIDTFTKTVQAMGLGGLAYVQVDKNEMRSPILKFMSETEVSGLISATGAKPGDLVFFAADEWKLAVEALGVVRIEVAKRFNLIDENKLAFLWVVDFPMFEKGEIDTKVQAVHHPFTSPLDEDLHLMDTDPFAMRAKTYDIVLNGYEVGGGSIRIHDPKLQHKVFEKLGLSEEEIQSRFGHILKAFSYGVPPHGGIAPGLDRLVMIFAKEPNIREVMAFPKTSVAEDLMMGSPSPLPEKRLKEAHIKLDVQKKK